MGAACAGTDSVGLVSAPTKTKVVLDESKIPTHWYNIVADLPEAQMAAVQEAKRRRQELRDVEAAAAKANRQAVAALRGSGLTVRDAAAVLGVSPQRISALDQPA